MNVEACEAAYEERVQEIIKLRRLLSQERLITAITLAVLSTQTKPVTGESIRSAYQFAYKRATDIMQKGGPGGDL